MALLLTPSIHAASAWQGELTPSTSKNNPLVSLAGLAVILLAVALLAKLYQDEGNIAKAGTTFRRHGPT